MRCKNDGRMENSSCYRDCGCHRDPHNMQAGPFMVRHVINGHEVLLPSGAKLYARLSNDDEVDLSDKLPTY